MEVLTRVARRKRSERFRIYSYVIDHDYGFAPNPFHGVCTLACCKPNIRAAVQLGDIVIGTGSKAHGTDGHLCYWMRVDETLTFDNYWRDRRFSRKRPRLNGSLISRYGDNIYHRDTAGNEWLQSDSFHSETNGALNGKNLRRDTSATDRVLVGREFCYWGRRRPPRIPEHLRRFVHVTQNCKCSFSEEEKAAFLEWLATHCERGCIGEPTDWSMALGGQ